MTCLSSLTLLRFSKKLIRPAISVRNVSNLNYETGQPNGDHIFKKLWTKEELIKHISSNVCYEDDNYIVVNKPYGVFSRHTEQPVRSEPAACSSTIIDILPELSAALGVPDLILICNPERSVSGVTILSKGDSKEGNILHNFKNLKQENRVYSFLTVVLGEPPQTFEEHFRIDLNKDERRYELLDMKAKKGLRLSYKHELLASSKGASLVKVDMDFNHLHCLKLVLATKCYTPVLGDFLYSPRVTTLFDVPLLVPPKSEPDVKILRPEILRCLSLRPEDVDCCPCHIHLYSTTFRLREKKFFVGVPPPEHFVWTCGRFGLDEIKHFCKRFDDSEGSEPVQAAV